MNKYSLKGNDWEIKTVEEYSSFKELIDTSESRCVNSWCFDNEERRRTTEEGVDFYKAKELLLNGWDEKIDDIRKEYTKFNKPNETQKPKQTVNLVGYAPCVPNAIIGNPYNMFNKKLDSKKTKVIEVIIDVSLSGIESNTIDKMVKLLGKINSLEMQGYRVKLTFMKTFNHIGQEYSYACKILLKNEFQPLDLKRVAFPLCHSAMPRKIMFDWYERLPLAREIPGHGKALGSLGPSTQNKIKGLLAKPNQYVITYYSNLDEVFKNLK